MKLPASHINLIIPDLGPLEQKRTEFESRAKPSWLVRFSESSSVLRTQTHCGGSQPFVFYVGRDTPRRLLKIEIVGQPLSFELVK